MGKHGGKGKHGKQPKQQAQKPSRAKEKGRQRGSGGAAWAGNLSRQLQAIGLRIKEVCSDGNCFFRALADQLGGDEGGHVDLRRRVVAHIAANQEMFEPFIEDEEPFDKYVARMDKDAAWGGHLELQAASLLLHVNISVHQAGQPAWTVKNFDEPSCRTLHLSYHDGEHYNSVRMADDFDPGPPHPIRPGLPSSAKDAAPGDAKDGEEGRPTWDEQDEQQVRQCTGCSDAAAVAWALRSSGGRVDEAVEMLVERMAQEAAGEGASGAAGSSGVAAAATCTGQPPDAAASGSGAPAGAAPLEPSGQQAGIASGSGAEPEACSAAGWLAVRLQPREGETSQVSLILELGGKGSQLAQPEAGESPGDGDVSSRQGRRAKKAPRGSAAPRRNQPCPCGSGRKYKSCCGVAAASKKRAAAVEPSAAAGKPAAAAVVQHQLQELYI